MPHAAQFTGRRNARPIGRSRRGSILILVVALVVLLALIGTAYLSSTQTDRYTSAQNTINTEADLQMQGLVAAVDGSVTGSLDGNTTTGTAYRPPSQDMPTYDGTYDANGNLLTTKTPGAAGDPPATGYVPATATSQDLFLATRVPQLSATTLQPAWVGGLSFPLFPKSDQTYSFDSPYVADTSVYLAGNKSTLEYTPTVYQAGDGTSQPGFLVEAPIGSKVYQTAGVTPAASTTGHLLHA